MRMSLLVYFGITLLILGFLFIFLGTLLGAYGGKDKAKIKYAVGGVLGFIPFGFANDKRLLITVLLISASIFVAWLIFTLLFYKGGW